MLKNPSTRPTNPSEDEAVAVGIKAVVFLADNPDLMQRFLDLSGLDVAQLRQELQRPASFVGLLDFILDHEPTLDAFAAHGGLRPEDVAAARARLGGPHMPSDP